MTRLIWRSLKDRANMCADCHLLLLLPGMQPPWLTLRSRIMGDWQLLGAVTVQRSNARHAR